MTQDRDITIPGMDGKATNKTGDFRSYRIRYFKGDLSDPGDLAQLEAIQTEAMEGDRLVLMSVENYSFRENYYVVLKYMEKRETTPVL